MSDPSIREAAAQAWDTAVSRSVPAAVSLLSAFRDTAIALAQQHAEGGRALPAAVSDAPGAHGQVAGLCGRAAATRLQDTSAWKEFLSRVELDLVSLGGAVLGGFLSGLASAETTPSS